MTHGGETRLAGWIRGGNGAAAMGHPSDAIVRSGGGRRRVPQAPRLWLAGTLTTAVSVAAALAMMMGAQGAAGDPWIPETEPLPFHLLSMEAEVVPVPDRVKHELRELLEEAVSEVQRRRDGNSRQGAAGWSRDAVIEVLRTLDEVLGRRGYLHPVDDRVDLLTEGLSPSLLDPADREALLKLPQNARRTAQLEKRFPGPFRFLDCDTATAVYLGVAERLGLPLRMVFSPSRNRQRGHVWVRWGQGARRVDWETTEGNLRTGFGWGGAPARGTSGMGRGPNGSELELEPSREEITGAWHYLLALQHERRGDPGAMLRRLEQALAAFPGHLDARRQLAWNLATLPGISPERVRGAVEHAREVVKRSGDADSRDTLAAALAASGDFQRAVREERAAIAHPEASDAARRGYRQRLALYEAGRAYRQPGRRPSATGGARDASSE